MSAKPGNLVVTVLVGGAIVAALYFGREVLLPIALRCVAQLCAPSSVCWRWPSRLVATASTVRLNATLCARRLLIDGATRYQSVLNRGR
jgi:hypothetical protein